MLSSADPIRDLTLIITTSPTPSAPSTELLSAVFASFRKHCPQLLRCKIIIVFDTFDSICDQARLKKGRVVAQGAAAFELYKANVKALIVDQFPANHDCGLKQTTASAEFGSPHEAGNTINLNVSHTHCGIITYIEPEKRLGFGLAVRSALRIATTSHVWIHQHDWELTTDIPLQQILAVMRASTQSTPVKYICFPSIRLLSYAVQHDTLRFPQLETLTHQLKQDFETSTGNVSLTPLFLWHDKPHIAHREHYLLRIFPSRYAMRRGDFIEDKVGQRARMQMKEGNWHKWATWLFYPEDGKQLCLHHLQGRVWRGIEAEEKQKQVWIARQKEASESSDMSWKIDKLDRSRLNPD